VAGLHDPSGASRELAALPDLPAGFKGKRSREGMSETGEQR